MTSPTVPTLNVPPDEEVNCVNCIFRVMEYNQPGLIGQSVGSPLCGKGLGPTALPNMKPGDERNVGAIKAKGCGQFKLADGASPVDLTEIHKPPVVMLPIVTVNGASSAPTAQKNCNTCQNFITPHESVEAGLWNAGMCAARGIMVTAKQSTVIARGCDKFRFGPRSSDLLTKADLMPEYTSAQRVTAAVDMMEVHTYIDPQEYTTDADLSDNDKTQGIKAWREVKNPAGDNSVMLPIFDTNFFTDEEQKLIPKTGSDEHPEEYIDHQGLVFRCAVLWMHLDETPALWGIAGTGKSEFYRHMAWLMGLPFHRISITASTEVEDLAGKMHFEPSRGTYFEYGRIPNAWMKPGVVCLDEPNVGPPDVWQFIRPLTDNSKQLVLDMNNGEQVSRHPMAFLGLAMNPAWDVRNNGTDSLADADGSRLMHIYVQLPNENIERQIIVARCKLDGFEIQQTDLDTVMRIAKDLRAMSESETLPITWGVRQQIKVARALRWFDFQTAYKLAAADYMEPEHQDLIKDAVKSHIASKKRDPKANTPLPSNRPGSIAVGAGGGAGSSWHTSSGGGGAGGGRGSASISGRITGTSISGRP